LLPFEVAVTTSSREIFSTYTLAINVATGPTDPGPARRRRKERATPGATSTGHSPPIRTAVRPARSETKSASGLIPAPITGEYGRHPCPRIGHPCGGPIFKSSNSPDWPRTRTWDRPHPTATELGPGMAKAFGQTNHGLPSCSLDGTEADSRRSSKSRRAFLDSYTTKNATAVPGIWVGKPLRRTRSRFLTSGATLWAPTTNSQTPATVPPPRPLFSLSSPFPRRAVDSPRLPPAARSERRWKEKFSLSPLTRILPFLIDNQVFR